MPPSSATVRSPRLTLVRSARAADIADADLARSAAEGDEDAIEAIWDRYAALVRGLLRRSLGPGFDVEDLVQETFLALLREVKNLRDPAALRPFLIGIAVRVTRSALRRRKMRRWLLLTDSGVLPDEPFEGADADAREALGKLYELLDRLDGKARMLFVLRYIEGLELTEAAEATGVSLATAKRHLAKVTARVHAMAAREPSLVAYLEPMEEEDAHGPA